MQLSLIHEATINESFWQNMGKLGRAAGGFALDMGKEIGLQTLEAIMQSGGMYANIRGTKQPKGRWRKGKYYPPRPPGKRPKRREKGIAGLPDFGEKLGKNDIKGPKY